MKTCLQFLSFYKCFFGVGRQYFLPQPEGPEKAANHARFCLFFVYRAERVGPTQLGEFRSGGYSAIRGQLYI